MCSVQTPWQDQPAPLNKHRASLLSRLSQIPFKVLAHAPIPSQAVDSQAAFSKWWRGEFKSVALPAEVCLMTGGALLNPLMMPLESKPLPRLAPLAS